MNIDSARRWQLFAIVLVIGALLWILRPVVTPFAIAAMLAYLGDPFADRLERLGCNRAVAASIVFLLMTLVLAGSIVLLVPLIQRQVVHLISSIPTYAEWVRTSLLPWLQQKLQLPPDTFNFDSILANIKAHIGTVGNLAAIVLGYATRSGLTIIGWVTSLVLIPVVTFYLLRDWDVMIAKIDGLLPRAYQPTVAQLARDSDSILGAFVRGQLLVMIALGVFYALALWAIGLDVGPLIGMIAGLVSFVPYLGFITGLLASLIAALVQYHDWQHFALVLLVFGVGQALEGYVLVPRLVGGKIGLHPVAVIFAILAFGHLFGFLGVLLALPAASVLMVLLRYAHERYTASALYDSRAAAAAERAPLELAEIGRTPSPDPIEGSEEPDSDHPLR